MTKLLRHLTFPNRIWHRSATATNKEYPVVGRYDPTSSWRETNDSEQRWRFPTNTTTEESVRTGMNQNPKMVRWLLYVGGGCSANGTIAIGRDMVGITSTGITGPPLCELITIIVVITHIFLLLIINTIFIFVHTIDCFVVVTVHGCRFVGSIDRDQWPRRYVGFRFFFFLLGFWLLCSLLPTSQ